MGKNKMLLAIYNKIRCFFGLLQISPKHIYSDKVILRDGTTIEYNPDHNDYSTSEVIYTHRCVPYEDDPGKVRVIYK